MGVFGTMDGPNAVGETGDDEVVGEEVNCIPKLGSESFRVKNTMMNTATATTATKMMVKIQQANLWPSHCVTELVEFMTSALTSSACCGCSNNKASRAS